MDSLSDWLNFGRFDDDDSSACCCSVEGLVGDDDTLPRLRVLLDAFELTVPLLPIGAVFVDIDAVVLLPGFRGGVVPDEACCHRPSSVRPARLLNDSPP